MSKYSISGTTAVSLLSNKKVNPGMSDVVDSKKKYFLEVWFMNLHRSNTAYALQNELMLLLNAVVVGLDPILSLGHSYRSPPSIRL